MIPLQHAHIDVAGDSHPGEIRPHNEDRFSITPFFNPTLSTDCLLVILADGVGGHQAGEVAAQISVEVIQKAIMGAEHANPISALQSAIFLAGQKVSDLSQKEAAYAGMGSTIAVTYLAGEKLYTATIGDSRIYRLHHHRLQQVSIDHTWVQEALDHKIITPEQAHNHPHAHVIQRAIGNLTPPEPDFRLRLTPNETDSQSTANQGLKLSNEDVILLCSDGLTDMVADHEIEYALNSQKPADAVQGLISLARARGGHDNITIVIFQMAPEKTTVPSFFSRRFPLLLLGIGLLLILTFLLSFLTWWLGFWPW